MGVTKAKVEKSIGKKETASPWETHHTETLIRTIVHLLLTSRPSFYHVKGMEEVNGHNGNRISQKVIEVCKKMVKEYGMDSGLVQEIISSLKGSKGVSSVSSEKVDTGGKKRKRVDKGSIERYVKDE